MATMQYRIIVRFFTIGREHANVCIFPRFGNDDGPSKFTAPRRYQIVMKEVSALVPLPFTSVQARQKRTS